MINIQETFPSCRRLLWFSSFSRPLPTVNPRVRNRDGPLVSGTIITRKKTIQITPVRCLHVRAGQVFETETYTTEPRNPISVSKYYAVNRRGNVHESFGRFGFTLVRVYRPIFARVFVA